jgi:hypothetical protein
MSCTWIIRNYEFVINGSRLYSIVTQWIKIKLINDTSEVIYDVMNDCAYPVELILCRKLNIMKF